MSRRPKFKQAFIQPVKTNGKKQDQMHAAYQYLLDHSVPGKGGMFKATVFLKNFDHFLIKVRSRQQGIHRVDEGKAQQEFQEFEKDFASWKVEKLRNEKMSRRISGIDGDGTMGDRFILWLYRITRNYLQK